MFSNSIRCTLPSNKTIWVTSTRDWKGCSLAWLTKCLQFPLLTCQILLWPRCWLITYSVLVMPAFCFASCLEFWHRMLVTAGPKYWHDRWIVMQQAWWHHHCDKIIRTFSFTSNCNSPWSPLICENYIPVFLLSPSCCWNQFICEGCCDYSCLKFQA